MRLMRWLAIAIGLLLACNGPETTPVLIAGETFELEVAIDDSTRFRGLGGRTAIDPHGGMLFVYPRPIPLATVMRDCPIAIDVAFLDADGRVLAVHQMPPEPPRRADETPYAYERRLPSYRSGAPAHFILETAGGRLAELGLRPGQRVGLDAASLIPRARR